MPQYVLQICDDETKCEKVGWLVKNFEVTPEQPIPSEVPAGRIQVVMTNTTSYNEISAVYDQYDGEAVFVYDEQAATIECTYPPEAAKTWPIN